MNVVYVYADTKEEWNCSEWRCSIPVRAIRRTKRHDAALISILDFVNPKGRTEALLEAADVIVVQRNLFGPVLQAIRLLAAGVGLGATSGRGREMAED